MSTQFHLLPFGVFSVGDQAPRVGVAIGDQVLDLAAALGDPVFAQPSLNAFLARGRAVWSATRSELMERLATDADLTPYLFSMEEVQLHLPIEVADFVDFYSSLEHASNAGRILRPGEEPLKPNWRHVPVGYHGRAGTVVVDGTPVHRPAGQYRTADDQLVFGPSARLDIEVELGFVVGAATRLGSSVLVDDFEENVFGVVVLMDWSARDIQAWEYVPLGPFLGKSFATSMSPWVVPLEALEDARCPAAPQDPKPLPHLRGNTSVSYDIALELRINGHVVSRPDFRSMYWTPAQQLAHMTSNGASLRPGDLYGSGTISSWDSSGYGSLMELTWNGDAPLELPDGGSRGWVEDGDIVSISATAATPDGGRVDLGSVSGEVLPCRTDHLAPAHVRR